MSLFLAVVIPKSPYPASDVNTEKPSIHSSTKTDLEHQPGQRGRKPGKKRGRTPKPLISHPIAAPSKSAEPLKFPKKRGPKPGSKVGKNVVSPKRNKELKRVNSSISIYLGKGRDWSYSPPVYAFKRSFLGSYPYLATYLGVGNIRHWVVWVRNKF